MVSSDYLDIIDINIGYPSTQANQTQKTYMNNDNQKQKDVINIIANRIKVESCSSCNTYNSQSENMGFQNKLMTFMLAEDADLK